MRESPPTPPTLPGPPGEGGAGAGPCALPFTGLSVWVVLLARFSLIGGGLALLRWARPGPLDAAKTVAIGAAPPAAR